MAQPQTPEVVPRSCNSYRASAAAGQEDTKAVRIVELRKLLVESEAERSVLEATRSDAEARASRLEAERNELQQQCEILHAQVSHSGNIWLLLI
jgi:hypothetical protein